MVTITSTEPCRSAVVAVEPQIVASQQLISSCHGLCHHLGHNDRLTVAALLPASPLQSYSKQFQIQEEKMERKMLITRQSCWTRMEHFKGRFLPATEIKDLKSVENCTNSYQKHFFLFARLHFDDKNKRLKKRWRRTSFVECAKFFVESPVVVMS